MQTWNYETMKTFHWNIMSMRQFLHKCRKLNMFHDIIYLNTYQFSVLTYELNKSKVM
jgi:hypothetical protein